MSIVDFTPVGALLGGLLIGVSVSLFLWTTGRVAGISGILGGLLLPRAGDISWRVLFVAGLFSGGVLFRVFWPGAFSSASVGSVPLAWMMVAGLLVGFGTRLGNGCTSGHGVCGLSRLSWRSFIATVTFIAAGAVTVLLAH